MRYKKLGNTGLLVSELALGTMTFGGKGYWTNIGDLKQDTANDIIKRPQRRALILLTPPMFIARANRKKLSAKRLKT